MYLLDSNIFAERLLNQTKSEEVAKLINKVALEDLAISDFALHSIGVILFRRRKIKVYPRFVQDLIIDGAMIVLSLPSTALTRVVEVISLYKLDFDDAYQYTVAEYYGVQLVSFDTDFDRTDLKRLTPADILATLK